MKVICDFCKAEYTVSNEISGNVQCALCSRVWAIPVRRAKNNILVLGASICALLAAAIFSFNIIMRSGDLGADKKKPLLAKITEISTVVDAFGDSHFVVLGNITNKTDDLFGLPDIIIMSHNADGDVISRQKFMPPATMLESGDTAVFSHTLSATTVGVKKLSIELAQ